MNPMPEAVSTLNRRPQHKRQQRSTIDPVGLSAPEMAHEGALLAQFLRDNSPVTILTGAGISTASGIPDYRDEHGNWKRKQPVQHQEFMQSLDVRRRYWARSLVGWPVMQNAAPNGAHLFIQTLEQQSMVHQVITQNVDRLHQKAGSARTIDLHGRADEVICMSCGERHNRHDWHQVCASLNPHFGNLQADVAPDGDADLEMDFSGFNVPDCQQCEGIMKPDVVFFGDNVPRPRVDECFKAIDESRALLVIGSSLMVYSGFRFARHASLTNKPLAILTRGRTRADELATLKLDADISMTLQRASAELTD
ncbi:NAD-dependent protein deacetylase [Pseudohongiella sp. O18]|uniref:NAD-dependent protein deacetylase n=1 Tax=Pseudohongiella sp. O18 TaxID=2904248 RepID=UPI00294FEF9E|nr:NAD-dependent protein deacetylase [Pseudohongiella sp. O18]